MKRAVKIAIKEYWYFRLCWSFISVYEVNNFPVGKRVQAMLSVNQRENKLLKLISYKQPRNLYSGISIPGLSVKWKQTGIERFTWSGICSLSNNLTCVSNTPLGTLYMQVMWRYRDGIQHDIRYVLESPPNTIWAMMMNIPCTKQTKKAQYIEVHDIESTV